MIAKDGVIVRQLPSHHYLYTLILPQFNVVPVGHYDKIYGCYSQTVQLIVAN